jgi:hypothetical protein
LWTHGPDQRIEARRLHIECRRRGMGLARREQTCQALASAFRRLMRLASRGPAVHFSCLGKIGLDSRVMPAAPSARDALGVQQASGLSQSFASLALLANSANNDLLLFGADDQPSWQARDHPLRLLGGPGATTSRAKATVACADALCQLPSLWVTVAQCQECAFANDPGLELIYGCLFWTRRSVKVDPGDSWFRILSDQ